MRVAVRRCSGVGSRRCRNRRRLGVTVLEVIVALGLLLAAAGAFAQMHLLAARQQRAAEKRAAAAQTLANWMERCSHVPFDRLTEDELTKRVPVAAVQEHLPGLEAAAKVVEDRSVGDERGAVASKQIVLTLRWPAAGATNIETAELVSWRHLAASMEEQTP